MGNNHVCLSRYTGTIGTTGIVGLSCTVCWEIRVHTYACFCMLQVVYVARNPKDLCVSMFHFFGVMVGKSIRGEFPDFFERFKAGYSK